MKRAMTISRIYPETKFVARPRPFIRITNKLLETCGFHVGDKIEVEYRPRQVIIKRLNKSR